MSDDSSDAPEAAPRAEVREEDRSGFVTPAIVEARPPAEEGASGGQDNAQPPADAAASTQRGGGPRVVSVRRPAASQQRGRGRGVAARGQPAQRQASLPARQRRPPAPARAGRGGWARPGSLTLDGNPRTRPRSASLGREARPAASYEEQYDEEFEDIDDEPRAGARGPQSGGRSRGHATVSRSRARRAVLSGERMEEVDMPDDAPVSWSSARLQQFANEGGLAARSSKSRRLAAGEPPAQDEVLRITTEDVCAVFGRDRAAVLRVNGVPMQEQQQKTWKMRTSQQTQLLAAGYHVPDDFCPTWFFFTFQFERNKLLATSPLKIHDLEQWLWMHSRWVIADVNDMSKQSDFLNIMTQVDALSGKLARLDLDLQAQPGLTVSQSLRQEFSQVLLRYTTVRADFVVQIVAEGIRETGLVKYHRGMETIARVFAHDAASLSEFLRLIQEQITTQSLIYDDIAQREGFISKAFLCMAKAFVCGMRGGSCPPGPNPLDSPPSAVLGSGARTAVPLPPPPPYVAPVPSASAPPMAGALWGGTQQSLPSGAMMAPPLPPPAMLQTIVQPIPAAQPVDLDTAARQVAAGYRESGPLIGGWAGGGAEGIDLVPAARRVLHAAQIQQGLRPAGALTITPPAGQLPSVQSYPYPFAAAIAAPLPSPAPLAWTTPSPAPSVPPSPYSTMRQDLHNAAGGSLGQNLHHTGQRPRAPFSDELYIPYSTGLLGSYSPYRNVALPPDLTCFECRATNHHFGGECPTRFARVRGEAPPGWKIDGPGAVSKNPAAWNGAELTDAARAEYRAFITRLSLGAHGTHPVTADEIVAAAPPAPRRPLPRFDGGGRRR